MYITLVNNNRTLKIRIISPIEFVNRWRYSINWNWQTEAQPGHTLLWHFLSPNRCCMSETDIYWPTCWKRIDVRRRCDFPFPRPAPSPPAPLTSQPSCQLVWFCSDRSVCWPARNWNQLHTTFVWTILVIKFCVSNTLYTFFESMQR